MTRVYLPTGPELIDRMAIVRLKSIFIKENKEEYEKELKLILSDIDTILLEGNCAPRVNAEFIHAVVVLSFANLYIWLNESKARAGGDECDKLLKLSHSINGVRNTAKNVLAKIMRDRMDFKIDSFAASLIEEYGQWQIWKDNKNEG